MKSFFPKITRKEPVPPETSPQGSCPDCETPHDTVSSATESPAGIGSLEALGKALEAGIVTSKAVRGSMYDVGGFLNNAINTVYTDSSISIDSSYPGGSGGYYVPLPGGSGGGGAGISGGPYVGGGGSYPNWTVSQQPPMPVKSEMKLNRRTLTPEEIQKVLEACATMVKPGEKVVFVADRGTTQQQLSELSLGMSSVGIDGIVISGVEVDPYNEQPVTSEFDRMDVLARLAVVWQENPNLRFGQLVSLALGMSEAAALWNVKDEDLGLVVEKAYRPSGKRMLKKRPNP